MDVRLDLFDISGSPLVVELNGSQGASFQVKISAGGSAVFAELDSNGRSQF